MNAREDHPARWRPHALTLKDHTNASVRLDIDILEIPVKVVFFLYVFILRYYNIYMFAQRAQLAHPGAYTKLSN